MPATRPAFFTSEFLAQLERLSLLSRRIFRGRVKGERRSLRRGHSVEFCDYRAYGVGDDLRYVDWNIYGRLDRLHVKLFVDEEDLCLHLIVDASASMNFGTPSKLDCAVRIAAALGFVGLVNLERVGVGVLRERIAEGWPPTRGRNQVTGLVDFLAAVRPAGRTSLNEALANYATDGSGRRDLGPSRPDRLRGRRADAPRAALRRAPRARAVAGGDEPGARR